jgi:hypothetical protein
MMGGGGGAGRISWWWWWGGAFASTRWDDGLGGKKTTKPSVMAQFQVCRVNWWLGVIGEGGRVAWMMWGWRRSLVFSNTRQHEGGEGLGADIPKPSHSGSVSGCFRAAGCRGGCCVVMAPPLVVT